MLSDRHSPPLLFPLTTTLTDRRRVSRCHNLRPDASGGLRGTGTPATIATLPGAIPVKGGALTLSDGGRCIITHHQGQLKAVTESGIKELAPLDRPPSTVMLSGDTLIVMPEDSSPICIPMGTAGTSSGTRGTRQTTVITLTRMDMTAVTAEMAAVTLKGSYDTSSRTLTDTDRATLDKGMREAYVRLCDLAHLQRRYIQPVVARYRLIGEGGCVLYTSAPVLISPEGGLQATRATLHLRGEGFRQTSGARLTATGFTIGLCYSRTPDAEWHAKVRSVEVLVSPQLHPLSTSLPGTFTRTGSSTGQLTFTHTLPGLDPLEPPGSPGGHLAMCITSIIDNADTTLRQTHAVRDTLGEISMLKSIAALPVSAPTADRLMQVRLSPPHTFTARSAARSGDLVAWGNLTAIPFDGYTLPEMASETAVSTGSTPTAVQLTMHDGSTVVSQAVMYKLSALTLSPLLLYPAPDACSITLIAGKKSVTLPLMPSPCGKWAYYLSPDLTPVSFTDDTQGFVTPPSAPGLHRYPSGIAVSHESSPLIPLAASAGDASELHSLLPSMRHSNSLTAQTARFHALGTGGISSVTLNERRTRISINQLYACSITDYRSATPIPGGVAALTGNRLIAVTGSRQPYTILDGIPQGMLGWEDSRGELWVIPGGDREISVIAADGKSLHTRASYGVTDILSSPQSLILVTGDGKLMDASAEDNTAEGTAGYAVTVPCALRPGSSAMLHVAVSGEHLQGTVSVKASHTPPIGSSGTDTSLPLATFSIARGTLRHPIAGRLVIPHCHYLTLHIELTSSSPCTIRLTPAAL